MSERKSDTTKKLHFVMVHGFGHGAWCWFKIRSLLETSDYKVSCIDLKGSGMDPSDPNTNKPFIGLLTNLPENEKVVLVGHSAGGMSLTYAIHRFAKKINMAIYVAATVLTPQDYKHINYTMQPFDKFHDVGGDADSVPQVFIKTLQGRVLKHDQDPMPKVAAFSSV